MGRKRNTELRRIQIVEAFGAILAEQGYAHATVAQIAKRLGVRAGLIHYHFDNKRSILLALIQTLTGVVQAKFAASEQHAIEQYAIELETSVEALARRRLFNYLDARLGKSPDVPDGAAQAWMMIGAEAARDPDVSQIYSATLRHELNLLVSLLAAALQRAPEDCSKEAHLLLAQIEGAFTLAASARELMPPGFAAPMARSYLALLFANA